MSKILKSKLGVIEVPFELLYTQQDVCCILGDGNCLFSSLAYSVTGSY